MLSSQRHRSGGRRRVERERVVDRNDPCGRIRGEHVSDDVEGILVFWIDDDRHELEHRSAALFADRGGATGGLSGRAVAT
jgi:hypothetical protein